MAWTNPKTWGVQEVVTAPLLNTEMRDRFNFLKSNPVIAETTAGSIEAVNTQLNVIQLSAISIPSDIGACYVEAWVPEGVGYYNTPGSGQSFMWGVFGYESTAGVLWDSRQTWVDQGYAGYAQWPSFPYYMRSPDYAWAGSTRTAALYIGSSNCGARTLGTSYIRIVRSY